MASTAVSTSRAEYDALTAAGERLEYDEGQTIEMPNNDLLHDVIKGTFVCELVLQLQRKVFAVNEMAFEIAPNKIRHPDVAVLLKKPAGIAGQKLTGSPDLAIEVVSPSENALDLHAKVHLYLQHGARAVWVVWPDTQVVDIHQPNAPTRHIGIDGVIEREEPVPEFRLAVRDLFEADSNTLDTPRP